MKVTHELHQAGDLDPGFASAGQLTINLAAIPLPNIKAVNCTEEGHVYVLCNSMATYGAFLIKYSAAGVQDLTYAGGKGYVYNDAPRSSSSAGLLLQGNSAIIISENVTHLTLDRYLENGLPDGTFGEAGRVAIPFERLKLAPAQGAPSPDVPGYPAGQMFTAAAGGRLFVAYAAHWNETLQLSVVVCLTSEGELDTGFDGKGYTVIDLAGQERIGNTPARLFVQTSGTNAGKPVLYVRRRRPLTPDNDEDFIVRLNVDGSKDYSFGTTDTNMVALPADEVPDIYDVILDEDDTLKVVGSRVDYSGAVRGYTANGTPDPLFNNGSLWTFPRHSVWFGAASSGQGQGYRLMTWGYNRVAEGHVYLNRVSRECEQDADFGELGRSLVPYDLPSIYVIEPKVTAATADAYFAGLGPTLFKVVAR